MGQKIRQERRRSAWEAFLKRAGYGALLFQMFAATGAAAIINGKDQANGFPGVFTICRARTPDDPPAVRNRPLCGTAVQFGSRCALTASHLVWNGVKASSLVEKATLWQGSFSKINSERRFEFDSQSKDAALFQAKEIVGGKPFGFWNKLNIDLRNEADRNGLPEIAIVRVGVPANEDEFLFPNKPDFYKRYPIGSRPKKNDEVTVYGYGLNSPDPAKMQSVRAEAAMKVIFPDVHGSRNGFWVFDHTAPFPGNTGVAPGDSGGPVFSGGKIVGLLSLGMPFREDSARPGEGVVSSIPDLIYNFLSSKRGDLSAAKQEAIARLRAEVVAKCGMTDEDLPNYASDQEISTAPEVSDGNSITDTSPEQTPTMDSSEVDAVDESSSLVWGSSSAVSTEDKEDTESAENTSVESAERDRDGESLVGSSFEDFVEGSVDISGVAEAVSSEAGGEETSEPELSSADGTVRPAALLIEPYLQLLGDEVFEVREQTQRNLTEFLIALIRSYREHFRSIMSLMKMQRPRESQHSGRMLFRTILQELSLMSEHYRSEGPDKDLEVSRRLDEVSFSLLEKFNKTPFCKVTLYRYQDSFATYEDIGEPCTMNEDYILLDPRTRFTCPVTSGLYEGSAGVTSVGSEVRSCVVR